MRLIVFLCLTVLATTGLTENTEPNPWIELKENLTKQIDQHNKDMEQHNNELLEIVNAAQGRPLVKVKITKDDYHTWDLTRYNAEESFKRRIKRLLKGQCKNLGYTRLEQGSLQVADRECISDALLQYKCVGNAEARCSR